MKNSFVLFVIIHLFAATVCSGQFGGLKKKLKKGKSQKTVNIDWESQRMLPAISLSSLLSNDGLRMELDGTLKISTLEISFLPRKDKNGDPIQYDPYQRKDMVLTSNLTKKGDDKVIHTFYFTVNPINSPFSLMTCIHRPKDDMNQMVQLSKGEYTLSFNVANKHVHSFDFEVVVSKNNDMYASGDELHFISGIWKDVGRISTNDYASDNPLFFEFYILNNTTDIENEQRPNKQKEMTFSFEVRRDGKLVAASNVTTDGVIPESIAQGRRGYWNIAGSQFVKFPAKKDRYGYVSEFFTPDDLKDGNYTIDLKSQTFHGDSKMEKFSFKVLNGTIVPLKVADRRNYNKVDDLIEQGPNYTFIQKNQ